MLDNGGRFISEGGCFFFLANNNWEFRERIRESDPTAVASLFCHFVFILGILMFFVLLFFVRWYMYVSVVGGLQCYCCKIPFEALEVRVIDSDCKLSNVYTMFVYSNGTLLGLQDGIKNHRPRYQSLGITGIGCSAVGLRFTHELWANAITHHSGKTNTFIIYFFS